tara:strand:- start:129 stop:1505 length:1377 start_codon:yes stop_codon:yes gene_type:complete
MDIDNEINNLLDKLGNLYFQKKDYKNSIKCFLKIIDKFPNDYGRTGVMLNNLGIAYKELKKNHTAIVYFKKIIEIKNDIPEVYNNIAVCYVFLKDYFEAEKYLKISFKLRQDDIIYKMLGELYFYMKEYEKSIFFYEKRQDSKSYNLCFPYLAKKNFQKGFELYEIRLKENGICHQTGLKKRVDIPNISYWDGIKPCNNLLIIYEQGIGDNVMYFRFILQISKKYPNMKITYFCKTNVSHLFLETDNIKITNDLKPFSLIGYDYKCYIMSLPYILKIKSIPRINNYNFLKIDERKQIYWKNKLKSDKLKVGFTYKGLLSSFIEKNIPLKYFEDISKLNIDFIVLHKKDETKDDMKDIDFFNNIIEYDIDKELPFEDTIPIIQNLDLVITIDSAIVHLAGSLNINTILMLGYGSDWRWFDNEQELWYNSVELLRMKENIELFHILPLVKNKIELLLDSN